MQTETTTGPILMATGPWTDAEMQRLRDMIATGKSFSAAADALGRSHSAATAMGKRLGLRSNYKPPPKIAAGEKLPPKVIGAPQKIFGGDEGKILADLKPHQCRYSIGAREDGDWVFCSEATEVGRAFCVEHHRLCYVPTVRKPR